MLLERAGLVRFCVLWCYCLGLPFHRPFAFKLDPCKKICVMFVHTSKSLRLRNIVQRFDQMKCICLRDIHVWKTLVYHWSKRGNNFVRCELLKCK